MASPTPVPAQPAHSGTFPVAESVSVAIGLAGLAAVMSLVSLMSAAPQAGTAGAAPSAPSALSARALAVSSAPAPDASRVGTKVPDASAALAGRKPAPEERASPF